MYKRQRLARGVDHIRCEADLRAGRIASFSACGQSTSGASLLVAGNPDLEPEESTTTSFGVVFQPTFIPERFGRFTFTAVSYTHLDVYKRQS